MQQELRIQRSVGICFAQANWTAASGPNALVPLHLERHTWLEHPEPRTGSIPLPVPSSRHPFSRWHTGPYMDPTA